MNLFLKLWAFVPAPAKIWVAVALAAIAVGGLGFMVWKIDRGGYNRCTAQYAAASVELKDKARKEILKAEKEYDNIKNELSQTRGADDPVGVRVELAIDRMPSPNGQ